MASNSAGAEDLMERSRMLYLSYLFTSNLDEIQEAVGCAQRALERAPPDTLAVPIGQYHLARPLVRTYLHTRQKEDVSRAIDLFAEASKRLADDNPMRQMCSKYSDFSRLVQDAELGGSIEQNDLHVCTSDSKTSIEALAHELLGEREEIYQYYTAKVDGFPLAFLSGSKASLEELNSIIHFHQQALKNLYVSPSFDPLQISLILLRMGDFLCRRASAFALHETADTDMAINCFQTGLKLPTTKRCFVDNLCFSSRAYLMRYNATGQQEDLHHAVNYAKRAAENIGSQETGFAECMHMLGQAMRSRYVATGKSNARDLDAAVDASLCAVNSENFDDPTESLPRWLMGLAVDLQFRHHKNEQFEDLRQAINIAQRAIDLWEPEDPGRLTALVRLSNMEIAMGYKVQDMACVKRGLQRFGQVWDSYVQNPSGAHLHPDTASFMLFETAGRRLFEIQQWDEAMKVMRMLREHPKFESQPQLKYYSILCEGLYWKYARTHDQEALNEAVEAGRHFMKVAAQAEVIDDNMTVGPLVFIDCLRRHHEITGSKDDVDEALEVALEGFRMSASIPPHRLLFGEMAIELLTEMGEWDRAFMLSKQFADLFVSLSSRSLRWTDKQYWLRLYAAKAPLYASIALQAGSNAFEAIDLLETICGSVLGHLIDNRADLDDLKKLAPKEAERLSILQDVINAEVESSRSIMQDVMDSNTDSSRSMNARIKAIARREEAEADIRACLESIRNLEGFERFLLGPTESEVKSAAAWGPIVFVNVTSVRSDAIIITKTGIFLQSLPELKHEDVIDFQQTSSTDISDLNAIRKMNKKYCDLLCWLWNTCVKLILQKLDDLFPEIEKFHVWWIGVGIADYLPFHAAGIYNREPLETALARIISSYTPSLKVLLYGRQKLKNSMHQVDTQAVHIKPRILIVTMPSTPGNISNLEEVEKEAERICNVLQESYSPLLKVQPSAREAMEHMKRCEIVHFACHGQSDHADPSISHLLLQTTVPDVALAKPPVIDKLRVRDVAALNLRKGKLAFLSACSTADSKVKFVGPRNEAIHLASAFHIAGYLHTIGNLWPADDEVSVQIVESFYKHLVEAGDLGDGQNVAKALNEALLDVVKTPKRLARQPLVWALFVHFGV